MVSFPPVIGAVTVVVFECSCLYNLLTYSMVQSPSLKANWFAASEEIPRISRNPKVHYRTHKRPPPVSILGQPNPVHIPTSHILEIHPNIIHLLSPRNRVIILAWCNWRGAHSGVPEYSGATEMLRRVDRLVFHNAANIVATFFFLGGGGSLTLKMQAT